MTHPMFSHGVAHGRVSNMSSFSLKFSSSSLPSSSSSSASLQLLNDPKLSGTGKMLGLLLPRLADISGLKRFKSPGRGTSK